MSPLLHSMLWSILVGNIKRVQTENQVQGRMAAGSWNAAGRSGIKAMVESTSTTARSPHSAADPQSFACCSASCFWPSCVCYGRIGGISRQSGVSNRSMQAPPVLEQTRSHCGTSHHQLPLCLRQLVLHLSQLLQCCSQPVTLCLQ